MIRVLHVFNLMGNGGIEHFVMERYRLIDKDKIQFDFLITSQKEGYFEDEIKKLGGKVFHTDDFSRKPFRSLAQTKRIVQNNHYDIVHRHTGNAIAYADLLAANMGGAHHLIIHSHNNSTERILLHKFAKIFLTFNCIRIACSDSAGEWLFGNKEYLVFKNAIDTSLYAYDEKNRELYRKKYNILPDDFVVGHIGRLDYQKNHTFLIEVFKEISKRHPNSKLLCIGDGHLKNQLIEKARQLGVEDQIIWTGSINNVNEVINCFDVFCFPSKYEGFSITLIEAQVNGLRCFASEKNVTFESNVSGNVVYIPFKDNSEEWAKIILNTSHERDSKAIEKVVEAGFDLTQSVKEMEEFYLELENE